MSPKTVTLHGKGLQSATIGRVLVRQSSWWKIGENDLVRGLGFRV